MTAPAPSRAGDAVEPTAGWFEGREHCLPLRVYYEDTDFTGVVYYANYARFLERGRSDFLRLAGVDHRALLASDDPVAFAVARLTIDFHRGARIDDALLVRTVYDEARGARLRARQTLSRGDDPIATAEVLVVCIDPNGRPRRLPQALRRRLEPFLANASSGDPP